MWLNHSATLFTRQCLAIFFVFVFKFSETSGTALVHYGQSQIASAVCTEAYEASSIVSLMRRSEFQESANSSKISGGIINLTDYGPMLSVLVPLVPDKAFVNRTEALNYFRDFHHGQFHVQAPPDHGVVATIQILRLFTVSGQPQKCLDYIQFKDSTNETVSPKICGKVNEDDSSFQPKGILGVRSFLVESGKMTVELIMVSNTLLTKWLTTTPGNNENLETVIAAEIAFTGYPLNAKLIELKLSSATGQFNTVNNSRSLAKVQLATDQLKLTACTLTQNWTIEEIQDDQNFMNSSLRPCCNSEEKVYCIHEQLFCDDIIQCGFDCDFGHDEDLRHSCSNQKNDLAKLDSRNQKLHYLNLDINHVSVTNGTRFNPQKVLDTKPVEVKVIQYFIIAIAAIGGATLLIGIIWWFRRSYRVFCNSIPHDDDLECHDNGTVHLPNESYQQRKSMAAIELQNILDEFNNGRLSRKHTYPSKNQEQEPKQSSVVNFTI